VADIDDVDALGATAVVDREQVAAGQREQFADAVRAQALCDQTPAMQARGGFGLRRQKRDANTRLR
jgi:hypothetical protein